MSTLEYFALPCVNIPFLPSSNPVRLVLSPWRQLTEPRYMIIQAHKMMHTHIPVTGIADSSKTHIASMITVILVFISR